MEKKVRWLRIAYWTAAIADFVVAVLVLIPSRMGVPQYVYPMGLMSAVAFSWGIILIMADRKAIERRWILIPTTIVVAMLGGVGLHAGVTEILPFVRVIPVVSASVVVTFILIDSYVNSRDLS
jgi:hypothetical protein